MNRLNNMIHTVGHNTHPFINENGQCHDTNIFRMWSSLTYGHVQPLNHVCFLTPSLYYISHNEIQFLFEFCAYPDGGQTSVAVDELR
jgi:hypothetical protein